MKKLLFTTLFAFFSFVLLHAQQKEPISQEEAKDIVFQKVLNHKTEGINLFVSKKVVSANSHIKCSMIQAKSYVAKILTMVQRPSIPRAGRLGYTLSQPS